MGPIPSDLTKDRREFDPELVNDCAKQVQQIEELTFKSSRLEKRRQELANQAKQMYGYALLPAIGELSRRLDANRGLRSVDFDPETIRFLAPRFRTRQHGRPALCLLRAKLGF